MTLPYIAPAEIAEATGDRAAAGLSAPAQPKPRFPRWLRDMPARHGIILVLAIWAGTFIAIWRLNP